MQSFISYTYDEARIIGHVDLPKDDSVSSRDLAQLEKLLDTIFGTLKIDIEFKGKHFLERINDKRNGKQITIPELRKIFLDAYSKHGKALSQQKNIEAVLNDLQTDLNIPFMLKWDTKNNELDLIPKTIMRKKNFKTPNKKYTV